MPVFDKSVIDNRIVASSILSYVQFGALVLLLLRWCCCCGGVSTSSRRF
jgi:hypothetical protein